MQKPSNLNQWVAKVLRQPDLTKMGHGQNPPDDLGLGWLYYSLARNYKPSTAVVIGSYRGFVPMMIGRALQDNGDGKVVFIDPSLVDDFWCSELKIKAYFGKFGLRNIEHHLMTTQKFKERGRVTGFNGVGMLFIDGYHSHEQAKFDFETFKHLLTPRSITLFHDSINVRVSTIYGKKNAYKQRVRDYIDEIRDDPKLQIFDIPVGNGVTLVRKVGQPERLFDPKWAKENN